MAINWAPSRSEEIRQCVATLVATTPGTVPYARALGVESVVDEPTTAAVQRLKVAAVRAVRAYEPRATVRSVVVERGEHDELLPTVRIEEVPA